MPAAAGSPSIVVPAALPRVQFTRRLVKGGRVLNSGVCSFCAGFVLDTFPVGTGPAKSNDIKLPISFAETGFNG